MPWQKVKVLLRSVIDATPDLIFVKDNAGNFILVNRAGAALYNMTPQQIQGLNEIDLIDLAGADVDAVDTYIKTDRQVINQKMTMIFPEEKITRGNMGTRWFRSSKIPLETQGKTDKVLVVSTDITDRKLALEALEQERINLAQRVEERTAELVRVNIELQESSRIKDEFLANMSHELRTPLNAILGMSEILGEQLFGSLNAKQLKHVSVIVESGRHLLDLINDILDLAKIESGQRKMSYEKVNIGDVCTSSLTFINQQALKKGIAVSYQSMAQIEELEADPRALKQILINLLNNAVKFTPEGGQIKLEVSHDRLGEILSFSITDTGIGIKPEQSKKLFKPFIQLDSGLARSYEGTGLGLSLILRLVDMHGGSVNLKSSGILGEGSSFTVQLPVHPTDFYRQIEKNPQYEGIPVLLMDDEPNSQERMRRILAGFGCKVYIADDNMDAIRLAKEISPRLILLDLQLPLESSLDSIRQLRRDIKTGNIPILSMSSLQVQGNPLLCVDAGADECLMKPVSSQSVSNLLEKYLLKH